MGIWWYVFALILGIASYAVGRGVSARRRLGAWEIQLFLGTSGGLVLAAIVWFPSPAEQWLTLISTTASLYILGRTRATITTLRADFRDARAAWRSRRSS